MWSTRPSPSKSPAAVETTSGVARPHPASARLSGVPIAGPALPCDRKAATPPAMTTRSTAPATAPRPRSPAAFLVIRRPPPAQGPDRLEARGRLLLPRPPLEHDHVLGGDMLGDRPVPLVGHDQAHPRHPGQHLVQQRRTHGRVVRPSRRRPSRHRQAQHVDDHRPLRTPGPAPRPAPLVEPRPCPATLRRLCIQHQGTP
jgi:hypothetical protein